jgi:alpha-beta hydrolase superfamily lysophospholipase
MSMYAAQLIAADGIRLHVQTWPMDTTLHEASGTAVLVHGLGEHIARYQHVAEMLNTAGWNVVGYDQRGHGLSTGKRGRIAAAEDLYVDLASVIDYARAEFPGRLVLIGHSMGGAVVGGFAALGADRTPSSLAWSRPIDGLVMSSPALDMGMSGIQKLSLKVFRVLAPNLAVGNGLKPAWISRDIAVVAAYKADPLVHPKIAARLGQAMFDAGQAALARAATWTVPTLLIYSESDKCVDPKGSAAFAAAAPSAVVTTHAFPVLSHEIFNEPEKADVFAVLKAWLNRL